MQRFVTSEHRPKEVKKSFIKTISTEGFGDKKNKGGIKY